jgi:hypothetical protein
MTTTKQSKQKQAGSPSKPEVLLERHPYRFVHSGIIGLNGRPDCRIQKYNVNTKRWSDMYLCDNELQLMTAMEDLSYTRWLDPEDYSPYYKRDVIRNPYPKY